MQSAENLSSVFPILLEEILQKLYVLNNKQTLGNQ